MCRNHLTVPLCFLLAPPCVVRLQMQRLLQEMNDKMKAAADRVAARMATLQEQADELECTLLSLVGEQRH